MARELGGDPPLVETEAPKKRLVREDEEQDGSDDEDEDEKRISFSGVRSKSQRQKIAEELGGWRAGEATSAWQWVRVVVVYNSC